ncbi:MAG: hypothetical protein LBB39_01410 [Mycoplasmataceae bacterium]|nr:hypothetical protein [Mycoplasmataceae bacterium]
MKKIHLLSLLLPIVSLSPIFLTLTSCSNPMSKIYLTNLGVTSEEGGISGAGKKFDQLDRKVDFWNIFKGNTKINNGNYVVFLCDSGSSTSPYTGSTTTPWASSSFNVNESYKFFNNSLNSNAQTIQDISLNPLKTLEIPQTKKDDDTTTADENHSNFVKSIKEWEASKHNNDTDAKKNWETSDNYELQFFSYILPATLHSYVNGADSSSYDSKIQYPNMSTNHDFKFAASVFSKWTDNDFCNIVYDWHNNLNHLKQDQKEWTNWEKHHNPKEYINNTPEAVNYRALLTEMNRLMPVNMKDKVDGKAGSSNMITIYYRKGKMNKIDLTSNGKTITDELKTIYTKGK